MPRPMSAVILITLLLGPALLSAAPRQAARLTAIDSAERAYLRPVPALAIAAPCTVHHDEGIVWRINGWVTGSELYKGYIDPAAVCPDPYPFTVTDINMPMYFFGATPLNVSVDVETIDNSTPGCPFPGELLTVSSEYQLSVPGTGLYDIWIPLDTPVTVNGPFFAGVFISNILDPLDSPAVVIDDVPVPCVSYNIWDTEIGWVDLVNNEFWNFPGRLVMYAAGIPSDGDPLPAVRFISPTDDDTLFGSAELWAQETSGSSSIAYLVFERFANPDWAEIGRDFDGFSPLRDGSSPADDGDGFAVNWDFGTMPEGMHTIRVTAVDTLGELASETIQVYLEPTPPIPSIVSPDDEDEFCSTLDLLMSCSDEDLTVVQAFQLHAVDDYSAGLSAAGPHGDGPHYTGPMAAAQVCRLWYDRGYQQVMKEGAYLMPIDTLASRLAGTFLQTDLNVGTYDEDMVAGFAAYLASKNVAFHVEHQRNPSYLSLRKWLENGRRGVIIGLGGTPGQWLAVDGFNGWLQLDGSYFIRLADPLTGTVAEYPIRRILGRSQVYRDNIWRPVQIMVAVWPKDQLITRQSIGADLFGADGWSIHWVPTGLTDGQRYFFHAIGTDAGGMWGTAAAVLKYDCGVAYMAGDYDNSGTTTVADLDQLARYIALHEAPPVGGEARADANGDGYINIVDVVYYINFLFGSGDPPQY